MPSISPLPPLPDPNHDNGDADLTAAYAALSAAAEQWEPPTEADWCCPSPARIREVMVGGKYSYSLEREWWSHRAKQVMPDLPEVYGAENEFLVRAVEFAIEGKQISKFFLVGDVAPYRNPVVDAVAAARSGAAVVGAVDDEVVKGHWQTHAALHPEVRVADGTFRLPGTVLRDEAVRSLFDSEDRVCLVLTGMLDAIEDTATATAVVRSYLRQLAPGSLVIVTHASVDALVPGRPGDVALGQQMRDVCRLYGDGYDHRPPRVLRTADEVRRVLGDRVELLDPIGPAVEWNNPGWRCYSRAELLCLGVIAQVLSRRDSGEGQGGAAS